MLHYIIAATALAATSPVEPAYDVYATPGQLIEIAPGRRLNLRCSGSGPVTVLLESGLGFPSYSWRKVQPALAARTRVCSYDRAGLGFSDPGPMPRSASAIASDLEALVDAAGLRPPFVLVANSLGSQSVRLFTFRRPADVAGMVLVDPYVEGQFAALAAIAPGIAAENDAARATERACLPLLSARALSPEEAEARDCIASPDPAFSPRLMAVLRSQRLQPATAETVFSESDMLETQSEAEVRREARSLGAMPLIVLTAGRNFADEGHAPAVQAALLARLRALHAALATLSTAGRETLVPDATHVIQSSKPDAVIEAVASMLPPSPHGPERR